MFLKIKFLLSAVLLTTVFLDTNSCHGGNWDFYNSVTPESHQDNSQNKIYMTNSHVPDCQIFSKQNQKGLDEIKKHIEKMSPLQLEEIKNIIENMKKKNTSNKTGGSAHNSGTVSPDPRD